ncbi:MAG: hypothetical protein ACREMY_06945 [bacterium]
MIPAEQHVPDILVCLDEGGNPRDPKSDYFMIGGAIAPLAAWVELLRPWEARLAAAGISVMHATDFIRCRKPFEDKVAWPPEGREVLLCELLDLIHLHLIQRGRGAYLQVFEDLRGETERDTQSIYLQNLGTLLKGISREMDERWPDRPVNGMIADHPEVSFLRVMLLSSMWHTYDRRFGRLTPSSPANEPWLQVADLLTFVFGEQLRGGPGIKPLYSHMTKGNPGQIAMVDRPPRRPRKPPTDEELRVRIRTFMTSGVLPPGSPNEGGSAFAKSVRATRSYGCVICGGPQAKVAYGFPGNRVVHVDERCDALWKQERGGM